MASWGTTADPFLIEVAGQPAALRRAVGALAGDVLAELSKHASRLPVFTGMGASYHACYPAVNALASRGKAAVHADAGELLHFRLPLLDERTLLVAVSQSGRSAEVVRLAESLRAEASRPPLLAVTNGLDNPLARLADLALDTRAGEEKGPSTMTLAASLAVLHAVAGVLAGEPIAALVRDVEAEVERAALAADKLLAAQVGLAEELANHVDGRPALVLLGRGPGRAAAEAGALLLKEVAALPAQSLSTGQFRHGPLELAGEHLAVVILATESRTVDLDLALAEELAQARSAVVLISPDGAAPRGTLGVAIDDVHPSLAPAVSIIPVQLLAWALARRHGRAPGPMRRATKVTTRE
jgi:glucosamine--fructose-6-phosphate aminotransferase (isomerizing)